MLGHPDDHLTDLRVRLHIVFRLGKLVEGEDAIDHGFDASVRDRRKNVALETSRYLEALFRTLLRVRNAEDVQAVEVQQSEIDLRLVTQIDVADDRHAAFVRERAQEMREDRSADEV